MLTRKMLKGMGITDDQIETIIEAHTETVDGLKDEISGLKEKAEKLDSVQSELDKAKKSLEAADSKGLEKKYSDLKAEYDQYKADVKAKADNALKDKAYRDILREAKISEKRFDAVMRLTDLSKVELTEDGKIKDAAEVLKQVKSDWSDYVQIEGQKGADDHNTPPAGAGGSGTNGALTKADILKIKDTAERQKAMIDNHELFGI